MLIALKSHTTHSNQHLFKCRNKATVLSESEMTKECHHFFKKKKKDNCFKNIILFLARLGLHCYAQTFSSCGAWGLLSSCNVQTSHYCDFSCCRVQALAYMVVSTVVAHRLSRPASRGIFLDQGRTHTPCIGRQALNHWTTRQVPPYPPYSCYFRVFTGPLCGK